MLNFLKISQTIFFSFCAPKKLKSICDSYFEFQKNLEKDTRTSQCHGECDSVLLNNF